VLSGSQLGAHLGTTTSSAASTVSTGTLVAGGVALLVIGAGMFAWLSPNAQPKPAAPPSTPAIPAATQPVEDTPAPEPAPIVAAPEVAAPAAPEQRATRESPLEREVAQMVRAKALVDDDPRAALGLLSRLEREHPRGALSEERAGLRVLALWKAGEVERAKTERELFLSRYPSSPMRERLAQLSEAP
jgi:hypothetical protein